MSELDRLTTQDIASIWPERFGWPFDIGGIAVLDGRSLVDPSGDIDLGKVHESISAKLHLIPRFRQILHEPGVGSGRPLWMDDASFGIQNHVRILQLEPGSGEAELVDACQELYRRRLDPARPRWELWLLPGLSDARVGLFLKMHHAIGDGVAGVATLASLLDLDPGSSMPAPPSWTPSRPPTRADLVRDNMHRRLADIRATFSRVRHFRGVAADIRRGWPAVREFFLEGWAPRTSINRPIGAGRRFVLVHGSLEQAKRIAHEHNAKVNDVLLAGISHGLRDLLRGRGEPVDGLVLRAVVPVSLHGQAADPVANLDGAMVVPLPIGISAVDETLQMITRETMERKMKPRPSSGTIFRYGFLQRAILRLYPRQRFVNVYVANVPGPPLPLFFAGARLEEIFPTIPILGNISIGIGALSYNGQFNLNIVCDPEVCPDAEVFARGVVRAFDQLSSRSDRPEEALKVKATHGPVDVMT